jgi:hypothetical protein
MEAANISAFTRGTVFVRRTQLRPANGRHRRAAGRRVLAVVG